MPGTYHKAPSRAYWRVQASRAKATPSHSPATAFATPSAVVTIQSTFTHITAKMNLKTPEDLFKEENLAQIVLVCNMLDFHDEWTLKEVTPTSITLECSTLSITIATTLTE